MHITSCQVGSWHLNLAQRRDSRRKGTLNGLHFRFRLTVHAARAAHGSATGRLQSKCKAIHHAYALWSNLGGKSKNYGISEVMPKSMCSGCLVLVVTLVNRDILEILLRDFL